MFTSFVTKAYLRLKAAKCAFSRRQTNSNLFYGASMEVLNWQITKGKPFFMCFHINLPSIMKYMYFPRPTPKDVASMFHVVCVTVVSREKLYLVDIKNY